ncbi:MAG: hypothetical protein QXI19_04050 [Candidatus Caldarchaeum sp.]
MSGPDNPILRLDSYGDRRELFYMLSLMSQEERSRFMRHLAVLVGKPDWYYRSQFDTPNETYLELLSFAFQNLLTPEQIITALQDWLRQHHKVWRV